MLRYWRDAAKRDGGRSERQLWESLSQASDSSDLILIDASPRDFRLGRYNLPSYQCHWHYNEGGDLNEILHSNA
jgi:hypothetical protein